MDNKRFPILAVVALVAVVLAAFVVFKRAPESEGSLAGGPLLPGLREQVNDIDTIAVTGAGAQPLLTLERGDDGWRVLERDGFPADTGKVREYLLALADARALEAKTANPERYSQLGVEDVDADDAGGVKVVLTGADGYGDELIIGAGVGFSGNTYARRAGDAGSWLASGSLAPERDVGQWLQRGISDIPSSRIREIELAIGDGPALKVFKETAEDANFTVADVPRGREVQSDFVANGMGSMLASFSLEDVARDADDAHGDAELHRATYRLFDGIVIDLTGWRAEDDAVWVRLSAELDEEAARAGVAEQVAQEQADAELLAAASQDDDEGEGDGGDADTVEAIVDTDDVVDEPGIDVEARTDERLAELRAEVERLNAIASGWRFRIPAYKFDPINQRMDDMLATGD